MQQGLENILPVHVTGEKGWYGANMGTKMRKKEDWGVGEKWAGKCKLEC